MPIERDRYPTDWPTLALDLKAEREWTCQQCNRQCRKPREPLSEFIERVYGGIEGEAWKEAVDYPGRFVLTTAHLDQNPANNDPSNLKALCSGCHLKNDTPHRKANAIAKKERRGQQNLFGGQHEEKT
jgi:hypothetical protein